MAKKEKPPVEVSLGVVLYTDGGCRPSRGIGGYGIHGYTFNLLAEESKAVKRLETPSALGYYDSLLLKSEKPNRTVTPLEYIDAYGSLIPESTNNIAELEALRCAFRILRSYDTRHGVLLLDSEYVLKGLHQWSKTWIERKWIRPDGTPVPNRELWELLIAEHQSLIDDGFKLQWFWVKGHNDNLGNELADLNACRGIAIGKRGRSEEHIHKRPIQGYWNKKIEYNRLLSAPVWYFTINTVDSRIGEDGRTVYHLGYHGGNDNDDKHGKPDSEHYFAVVYLKDPDPVLETLYANQLRYSDGIHRICYGYLSNVFSSGTYAELSDSFDHFTWPGEYPDFTVSTLTKQKLSQIVNPPRHSFRGIETSNTLQGILDDYLNPETAQIKLVTTDLTPYFYEQETTSKKTVIVLCGYYYRL